MAYTPGTLVAYVALSFFSKQGIEFRLGCMTKAVEKTAGGAKVTVEDQATKKSEAIEAEKVLVAIGVAGRFDGLFDASLGLKTDKGHIVTDYVEKKDKATYATSVPGVYAIGDVIGPPWLARRGAGGDQHLVRRDHH
ncbi:MAG: FAD-dependent oxidoreductase, partial [Phycisphaerales bacterium]